MASWGVVLLVGLKKYIMVLTYDIDLDTEVVTCMAESRLTHSHTLVSPVLSHMGRGHMEWVFTLLWILIFSSKHIHNAGPEE